MNKTDFLKIISSLSTLINKEQEEKKFEPEIRTFVYEKWINESQSIRKYNKTNN
jgi:hypothetical protein